MMTMLMMPKLVKDEGKKKNQEEEERGEGDKGQRGRKEERAGRKMHGSPGWFAEVFLGQLCFSQLREFSL